MSESHAIAGGWSESALGVVQPWLKRLGVYYRLRASGLYDLYWTFADKRLLDDRRVQLEFYRTVLKGFRPGHTIFDIGANQGTKTDVFLRLGARVVAVDPDTTSLRILREKFLAYRLFPKPVVIVPMAMSDAEAVETMWIDAPGSTMNTLSPKWVATLRQDNRRFGTTLEFDRTQTIATTTLDRLMRTHGTPFFIKIDVEGFESAVLRGLTSAVPYLSFEVNLPEFRKEGIECIERLAAIAGDGRFNFVTDLGRGLASQTWLPAEEFMAQFGDCSAASVEVFWSTRVNQDG